MTLRYAIHALNELSCGRETDSRRVVLAVRTPDARLGSKDRDPRLVETAVPLNLYLVQGIGPYRAEARRSRATHLAEAIQQEIRKRPAT